MSTASQLKKLSRENARLAAELADAQEVLRALRCGEVDALVSSGNDAVYAVHLIALAVDRAETYTESLSLLLSRLCQATGWVYGEAWAASEDRRRLLRTPVWFGASSDAIRLHEMLDRKLRNPAEDATVRALRTGEPQWIALEDLNGVDYAEILGHAGLRTGLALPLVASGKVNAVLLLWGEERAGDRDGVVEQARQILQQAAPFVQRKREEEARRRALDALKGMVHERSQRLAELSGKLQEQSARREQAEILSRNHQEASFRSKRVSDQQAALLQSILDGMAEAVIVTDPAGRVLQLNPAAQRILGDIAGDVPLASWPETYGLHQPGTLNPIGAEEFPLMKAIRGEPVDRAELFVKSALQTEGRTIAMSGRPLRDRDNSIFGAIAVFQDVTQRKREEERRIQRLVEQRDILVREVHHRIKNNLAGVVGLLHQYTRAHPGLEEIGAKLESQLYAVAGMHGLEGMNNNGGISLGGLIHTLGENNQAVFKTRMKVNFGKESEGLRKLKLRESESVPLALALNELLVNARKHGRDDCVEVRALRDGGDVILEIASKGRPEAELPDLDAAASRGGGLGLVLSLLPHESASLKFEYSGGRVLAVVRLPGEVFEASK